MKIRKRHSIQHMGKWILSVEIQFQTTITMSKLFLVLACLAVAFAVATAEPRFAKLQTKVGCSVSEIFACESEIEGAYI